MLNCAQSERGIISGTSDAQSTSNHIHTKRKRSLLVRQIQEMKWTLSGLTGGECYLLVFWKEMSSASVLVLLTAPIKTQGQAPMQTARARVFFLKKTGAAPPLAQNQKSLSTKNRQNCPVIS
jgi:hypothetical protein